MRAALVAVVVLTSVLLAAGSALAEQQVYGKGISDTETILISELLATPDQYLDQNVRVAGPVVGVCKKRGCWMDLASDQEFQKITIKVEDGEIVFPASVLGQYAVAEGVLTALPLTQEQAQRYLAHEATCQGEEFDPESIGEEGMILYRIQGTGAVVREDEGPVTATKSAPPAEAKPASGKKTPSCDGT